MTAAEARTAANIAAEGDARWALVGASTASAVTLYSWITPIALNLGSVATATQFAGVSLLTAAAGFFVPFALTLNSPMPWAAANMFYAGAFLGPLHAQFFLTMIKYVEDINNFNLQPRAAVSVAFGALETAGGLLWVSLTGMTAGEAHSIIAGSNLGFGAGLAIGSIFVASSSTFDWLTLQVPSGLALAGVAGGAVAGAVVGPWLHLTWGDAELLQLSAGLGSYVTAPFIAWANATDSRAYSVAGLVGLGGGLVGGYYLLHFMEGSHLALGQAVLIDLGTVAGALVGLGGALVLGGFADNRITLTTTMVGAVGGFAISYIAMRSQAQQGKKAGANIQMTLNPAAVAGLVTPKAPGARELRPSQPPPPVVAFVGAF